MGIVLNNISKYYNKVRTLSNINLSIEDGRFCVLLGPSGCGKTTLLRVIAGLEAPDEGRVMIDGADVTGRTPKERDIAMVFQNYALYPHMNVYENMSFALKLKRIPQKEIDRMVINASELLNIRELLKRRPSQLSGGQKQRVAIGRAIVREPKAFLFDEPLSNLDALLRADMRVELAGLHKRLKATMVYVTHDQTEAMTLADRMVVLNGGEVQQEGTPQEIYGKPSNIFVAGFVGSPAINLIEGEVCVDGGRAFFVSSEIKLEIDVKMSGLNGAGLVMGVRPPDITIKGSNEGKVKGRVEIVEDTGAERLIYIKCGDFRFVVKTAEYLLLKENDPVSLDFDMEKALFFHNGRRIELY